MTRGLALCVIATVAATPIRLAGLQSNSVTIGSKSFTESVILGEIAAGLAKEEGYDAIHQEGLGGTRLLFNGLVAGELDVYAEYTGTIFQEIFSGQYISTVADARRKLDSLGIRMTEPLGFNNTYAVGVLPETATRLGLRTISDLKNVPSVRIGFSNEFMDRADGWPSLQREYELERNNARGLDHDLAYRALEANEIDAIDVYTTDAEIAYYGLTLLEDDKDFFQTYFAVFLYRKELAERAPEFVDALLRVEGRIDEQRMQAMNARAKLDGEDETAVAADFLANSFAITSQAQVDGLWHRLKQRTLEHLFLVLVAMAMGISCAIPLGVVAFKRPRLGVLILGAVSTVQTIPALALLVFMIPLLGIYSPPAIAALFLYSLLPIVRNTHAGLSSISLPLQESMDALDLTPWQKLKEIELPLASPSIMAGIKTATVINIGFATLGALIGAGGYGQPILTGIRLDDMGLILEGAIPAALLALLAQAAFGFFEKKIVPRGLRLRRTN
ncbi:MAG: ABC transporter permease subunit [Gemmatimonadota bacterium]|nr:ABC transporter permease subunit [Gemmatimonadota bacterium]